MMTNEHLAICEHLNNKNHTPRGFVNRVRVHYNDESECEFEICMVHDVMRKVGPSEFSKGDNCYYPNNGLCEGFF